MLFVTFLLGLLGSTLKNLSKRSSLLSHFLVLYDHGKLVLNRCSGFFWNGELINSRCLEPSLNEPLNFSMTCLRSQA